ncbi:MAG: hypothetical protein Q8R85_07310 [Bosea sp. (in: a-proteobacteria)]|uniref:hypothetical protein n=1 Tax=Bosea sp. (in: a-proteobacteria) TaxID=1871050 RepID=UPI0027357A57|nr:hypothetical protein [Bosea sp. (in: a-proteobacteria)]MDP3600952.1 hypothetical protein [Bosea sp. (in: a-proteobacteria)]
MKWNEINFGTFKDRNYSIAQLAYKEPSYLGWCLKQGVFKGESLEQARLAADNLRNMRLPMELRKTHCIQFLYDWQGKLSDVKVVETASLRPERANNEIRGQTLNLLWKTDGIGKKLIIKAFKKHWLNGKSLTKKRLEELLTEPLETSTFH